MNARIQAAIQHWRYVAPVLQPARNEKEYAALVEALNAAIDAGGADENHPLAQLVEYIGDLVSRYEQEHYPIEPAEPKEVLRMLMDARGLKQGDLSEIVPQSNLSAILAGKRKISATLAGKLGKFFGISPAVFVPG